MMEIEYLDFEVIELDEFEDEFVYDLDMDDQDQPWFFANDLLIHNSGYFSLKCLESKGYKLFDGDNISDKFYSVCEELEKYINENISIWCIKNLRTIDNRIIYKRESIADCGIFLAKKHYVLHILDDEGIKVNKFKYKGVAVVTTKMPRVLKPHIKKIIEHMILTKSLNETNDLFMEAYEIFKNLPIMSICKISGMNNYEAYSNKCNGVQIVKKMPPNLKSAYFHDYIVKELKLESKYPNFKSGDKVRSVYIKKPNKYNILNIGFKDVYPKEFEDIFVVDYEVMFIKMFFDSIESFYDAVGWKLRKPNENVKIELEDLFY